MKNKTQVEPEIEDAVTEYVYENYRDYKDMTLFITESDNCFFILKHPHASPLILSKKIIN